MKLALEFPSVVYREGPEAIARLAGAMDEIGFDQLDIFDHVVMGHDTEGRERNRYPAKMPIMEAFATLGYMAACTSRIGLGTEVLVLPQRDPVLAAKQAATLDTLSGGRLRLGLGVGWQESEYEALGHDFRNRGRRMDERSTCSAPAGARTRSTSRASSTGSKRWRWNPNRRVAERCRSGSAAIARPPFAGPDGSAKAGWESPRRSSLRTAPKPSRRSAGTPRKPAAIRRRSSSRRRCRRRRARQRERPDLLHGARPCRRGRRKAGEMGFDGVALNLTGLFLAGARTVEAMIDGAAALHEKLRAELG